MKEASTLCVSCMRKNLKLLLVKFRELFRLASRPHVTGRRSCITTVRVHLQ